MRMQTNMSLVVSNGNEMCFFHERPGAQGAPIMLTAILFSIISLQNLIFKVTKFTHFFPKPIQGS